MTATASVPPAHLVEGNVLYGGTRYVTHERMIWYGDGIYSATMDKAGAPRTNIHTSDEYAQAQGFTRAIADGMLTTNWISAMLTREFGLDYLSNGSLRTKYIKPTYVGATVSVRAKVTQVQMTAEGLGVSMVVWSEDEKGMMLTEGDARVVVTAGGGQ